MNITRTARVSRELIEIADYFDQINEEVADPFLLAVENTFRQISIMPGIGEPWKPERLRHVDVRRCMVTGFRNYLVYYQPIAGGVQILRVVHSARQDDEAILEDNDLEA